MFNLNPIKWIKKYIYNKIFQGGSKLTDETITKFDNGLLNIAYNGFKPVLDDSSLLLHCSRNTITRMVQYSINYAKENKSCFWLWGWLRELRDLLNKLDFNDSPSTPKPEVKKKK